MGDFETDPIERAVGRWLEREKTEVRAEQVTDYHGYIWRKVMFIILCAVGAFIISGYALTVGPYDISILESYGVVWDVIVRAISGTDMTELMQTSDYRVIWEMRFPRMQTGPSAG